MRTTPTILHVDLDAFFAAVEQRDRPELRGRPVIVGGDPHARGVVSAASYEARAFGVRSAMPLRTASALCPGGAFLPVDGAKYRRESRRVMEILGRFTPLLEQVSIDEAFLDVAGSEALFGSPEEIARRIKAEVRGEVGLTASVGAATTKLVAKVASDLRKPDGLVIVPPGDEAAFLAPLPIRRLWGVGEQTRAVLAEYGVHTIGDLAELPIDVLVRRLGAHAATLHERARGIDPSPVTGDVAAKSVSHEHTFDVDTADAEVIERTLLALAEGVASRLRAGHVRASTVAVKVRDSAFHTVTRQRTLAEPTDLADPIFRTALELVRPEARGRRIRLLGVGAHGLGEPAQMGLFETEDPRRRRAVEAQDEIRRRYGSRALTRARLLGDPLADPGGRDPLQPLEGRRVGRARPGAGDTDAGGSDALDRPDPPAGRRGPGR
ncbi:MAG TPA: DNA polymerase IV [Patescibacteria group bacterium]|nr:DNA polymerase IV [Patescibacteria group bacterium]